jgi:hypothetical protein
MSVYFLVLAIALFADKAMAGCIPSKPAKSVPGPQWLNKCPRGIPRQWACQDPKITFPTVDCIAADIEACGALENNPALFYSFGAKVDDVRTKVRDKLSPKPVMFNDVLPLDWEKRVIEHPRFGLVQGKIADPRYMERYDAYIHRRSAAMAQAAKGEVILVTLKRTSENTGVGAYSLPDPKDCAENTWRVYEFPMAQRNSRVTSVASYALEEKPLKKVVDFQPGRKGMMLPEPSFPNPPKPASPQQPAPGSAKPKPASSKPAPAPPKKPGVGNKLRRNKFVERREKMLRDARK